MWNGISLLTFAVSYILCSTSGDAIVSTQTTLGNQLQGVIGTTDSLHTKVQPRVPYTDLKWQNEKGRRWECGFARAPTPATPLFLSIFQALPPPPPSLRLTSVHACCWSFCCRFSAQHGLQHCGSSCHFPGNEHQRRHRSCADSCWKPGDAGNNYRPRSLLSS